MNTLKKLFLLTTLLCTVPSAIADAEIPGINSLAITSATAFAIQAGSVGGAASGCGQDITTFVSRVSEALDRMSLSSTDKVLAMASFQKALSQAQSAQTNLQAIPCVQVNQDFNSLPIMRNDYQQSVLAKLSPNMATTTNNNNPPSSQPTAAQITANQPLPPNPNMIGNYQSNVPIQTYQYQANPNPNPAPYPTNNPPANINNVPTQNNQYQSNPNPAPYPIDNPPPNINQVAPPSGTLPDPQQTFTPQSPPNIINQPPSVGPMTNGAYPADSPPPNINNIAPNPYTNTPPPVAATNPYAGVPNAPTQIQANVAPNTATEQNVNQGTYSGQAYQPGIEQTGQ